MPGLGAGQVYAYRAVGPFDPARGLRFDPAKVLLEEFAELNGAMPPMELADDLSTLGDRIAILSPLAAGVSAIVCTIIIHALALTRRQMSFAVSEELGRAGARRWVYGNVIMTPSWRLLGPLEAANGMLMFGVSTAMIFAVIQLSIQARFLDLRD